MTRLIVVCGLPGTGKTTLADVLSERLKMFCLHKDSVKESLYEHMLERKLILQSDRLVEQLANEVMSVLGSEKNYNEFQG